jgi:hypothetical protein
MKRLVVAGALALLGLSLNIQAAEWAKTPEGCLSNLSLRAQIMKAYTEGLDMSGDTVSDSVIRVIEEKGMIHTAEAVLMQHMRCQSPNATTKQADPNQERARSIGQKLGVNAVTLMKLKDGKDPYRGVPKSLQKGVDFAKGSFEQYGYEEAVIELLLFSIPFPEIASGKDVEIKEPNRELISKMARGEREETNNELLIRRAREAAEEFQPNLPMQMGPNMVLRSVFALGTKVAMAVHLNYNEATLNAQYRQHGLGVDDAKKGMTAHTTNGLCSTPDMAAFITLGGSVMYKYQYQDGTLFAETLIDSCEGTPLPIPDLTPQ